MVIAMITLVHLCVKVDGEVAPTVARRITGKGPCHGFAY